MQQQLDKAHHPTTLKTSWKKKTIIFYKSFKALLHFMMFNYKDALCHIYSINVMFIQ